MLQPPLHSGLQHLNHVLWVPPLCISPLKVMEILSLAAWPLVILFHRPAPCWSQHNGRRSASSQSIFWQTWLSKLVSFGKGMTKDLFNTLPESIKTSEQHASFFFCPFTSLPCHCVWLLSRVQAPMCASYKLPPIPGGDQRLKWLMVCVIRILPLLVVKELLHDRWMRLMSSWKKKKRQNKMQNKMRDYLGVQATSEKAVHIFCKFH